MAKYTEGEWKLSEKDNGGYGGNHIIADGFIGTIAEVNMDCYKCQANANLIAAAPALYEALKAAYDLIPEGRNIKTQIEIALAKAEGK